VRTTISLDGGEARVADRCVVEADVDVVEALERVVPRRESWEWKRLRRMEPLVEDSLAEAEAEAEEEVGGRREEGREAIVGRGVCERLVNPVSG
jgi:hypothetical protein